MMLQLDHSRGGFLVGAADYDECAERVAYLLTHPYESAEFARYGKEHVHENFWSRGFLATGCRSWTNSSRRCSLQRC